MQRGNLSRRGFLSRSALAMAAAGLPAWYARETLAAADEAKKPVAATDKINVALIGCGGQGRGVMRGAMSHPEIKVVALCDVDRKRREEAHAKDLKASADVKLYEDFRQVLDRKDVNAVIVGTPDHWHTLVSIAAMKKGMDVYCEKPLTLTIGEGKALVKVAKETKRIFQVGSQQRSSNEFRLAVELARNGRLGKISRIETWIGKNPKGGPFKSEPVPEGLNWDMWLGSTPKVEYIKQRCHYEFRWWYDYSGGKLTDWGAHHNDIAQWALDMDGNGPISVESTGAKPADDGVSYNCHPTFEVTYGYASGAKVVCKSQENGVLIEGEGGRWIFVQRGGICASDNMMAKPAADIRVSRLKLEKSKLLDEPLGKDAKRVYFSQNHMRNWIDGMKTRKECVCTAEIGHRSVTVCHLGAISLRTGGKKFAWDPAKETSDSEAANKMLSREMRGEWKLEA